MPGPIELLLESGACVMIARFVPCTTPVGAGKGTCCWRKNVSMTYLRWCSCMSTDARLLPFLPDFVFFGTPSNCGSFTVFSLLPV